MECVEFYDFIYNAAYPFEGGASSLSSVRNRRFYHREFSGNDDNGPMGTKISINGSRRSATTNAHRVMKVNKMRIMMKAPIPTGTGITRLVIPILSSGFSSAMTKQAAKTIFQTSGIAKPHTKWMTPRTIPKLKGYLRLNATVPLRL